MNKQVIFIMTDTQRTDMLGCYGNEDMHTPNLDRLADSGLRYTKAQTATPVCAPARSAIFTGLFPHTNGVVTNSVALSANVKTIGQRLTDNGIHSGYVGKWHLDGSDYFGNGFCPDGWDPDYWYDMKTYLDELTEDQRIRSRKSKTSFDEDFTEELMYAHRCSDKAIDFIEKFNDEDFFLTVSYDEPHGPCLCPAPYNTMYDGYKMPYSANYEDDLQDKTLMQRLWSGPDIDKDGKELNVASDHLSLFLGCNSFVDAQIGRVVNAIEDLCPNAMIIYTADHGDMMKNHKLSSKNCCVYKEVQNIPLLIKGGAQGVIDEPASHIDIVPTIMAYMDLPIPKQLQGKSMMAQIEDGKTKINDYVFSEFVRYEMIQDFNCGYQPMRTVFDGRYKLAINLLDKDELYDTYKDPEEITNLIDDQTYQEIRNKRHDVLLEWMDESRDVLRGYQWACRTWRPDLKPSKKMAGYVRQTENEEYEPRQLNYDTGMPMETAVRKKVFGADKK